jgi:hypothetical protein
MANFNSSKKMTSGILFSMGMVALGDTVLEVAEESAYGIDKCREKRKADAADRLNSNWEKVQAVKQKQESDWTVADFQTIKSVGCQAKARVRLDSGRLPDYGCVQEGTYRFCTEGKEGGPIPAVGAT